MNPVELLAPAGNFETALAAFAAGADAVYCGLQDFSARAFADNFSFEDLEHVLAFARKHGKQVYVTFNTLLDEDQFDGAIETLARLEDIGPDGVIVQDLGVAKLIRENFLGLALHASTQLVAHNLEGVLAMKELGFKRVVLARELSLEEITSIARRCGDMELEVFIHGALCYSISGLCLFGAMEKGRSGNRGKCPYCCRQAFGSLYPFSMKDLRLGEDVRKLADAGVASLKIEGRMKSALYVASVTRYYREILDGNREQPAGDRRRRLSVADLETVFSRRTTKLYFDGRAGASGVRQQGGVIDSESLGHLGAEIGVVKRIAKDREGLSWLRFHTARGLEKHDGLQFEAMTDEGRHLGMGIVEMRQAISRRPVFEVNAGVDVEVLVTEEVAAALKPGMRIYCSMSNAVKRMFPAPSFRPSDYPGLRSLEVSLTIARNRVTATAETCDNATTVSVEGNFEPAKNPDKTRETAEKAFSKLGGTGFCLTWLGLDDPDKLFVPMSVWNDLRRDFIDAMNDRRRGIVRARIDEAKSESFEPSPATPPDRPCRRVKIRAGQPLPVDDWDEVVVGINAGFSFAKDGKAVMESGASLRWGLPVYTAEPEFNKLRVVVKQGLRSGQTRWEASDLATLRMLKELGVTDLTADWTLYAFNSRAFAELSKMGVKRFVASPENSRENLQYLAESGYDVEFLAQQSTPLFVSLTQPAAKPAELAVFRRDGLWVTTNAAPRTFETPRGASVRTDLSWDPE